jgi:hypothetical protein
MKEGKPTQKKHERLASDIAVYLKKVGRKAQKGQEPNDRCYDRELERKLQQLRPADFDALVRAGEEDDEDLI